jgi:hypothetical protein
VPNWSISRNYKENWNSTKISVTLRIHLTRGGSVQRPLTSGPRGWPAGQAHFSASHGLASWACSPGGGNKESKAGSWWKLDLVAALQANTWCVTDLIRSVTPPWTPINTPLLIEFRTPHSTCSSPLLKVSV